MKKRVMIILALAVIVGLFCTIYDAGISQFIVSLRAFIPDWFFIGFTFEIQTLVILFFLTSLFLFQEQKRRWILPLWVTAGLAIIISYILKVIIARPRPFEMGIVGVLAVVMNMLGGGYTTWNSSFPSFQAVLAFSALPILEKEFPRFKWVWIAIVCIMAFSRVYFGVHYLSDVIIGAVIGYLLGTLVVKAENEYEFGSKFLRKFIKNKKKTKKRSK